ncbi:MAG: hypothetical protein DRI34_13340 [Deltaproteobacteria bacterium]|nr:MAG: hypothetical protein DRI34_13340 [Deltaproteobacteria bacterium]
MSFRQYLVTSLELALIMLVAAPPARGRDQTEKLLEQLQQTSYHPPSMEQWLAAGLRAEDLPTAQRYEVTIGDWQEMERSRRTHQVAGWSCLGLALLAPAVEATLHWGAGIPFSGHPNLEVFIVSNVAVGAVLITGIVLLSSAPGPEDFKLRWQKRHRDEGFSFTLSPSSVGLLLRF